jgi:hypothetical protein
MGNASAHTEVEDVKGVKNVTRRERLRLAQIYEEHAEECLRTAARMDDPKRRDLMLKLANQWREDAKALRRGEAPRGAAPAPARRNKR